jgi:hypothetical protein
VGRWPRYRLAAGHAVDHDVQEAADHQPEEHRNENQQEHHVSFGPRFTPRTFLKPETCSLMPTSLNLLDELEDLEHR